MAKRQESEIQETNYLAILHPGADVETAKARELSVVERRTIQDLADRHGVLASTHAAAEKTRDKSKRALDKLTSDLETQQAPKDAATLTTLCASARQEGDLEKTLAEIRDAAVEAVVEVETA